MQATRKMEGRVRGLQARHDLASGEYLDLELVVTRLGNGLSEGLRRAIEGVERFRKARGEPPPELRRRLRDRRLGESSRRDGNACRPQELTTFHDSSPELVGRAGAARAGLRLTMISRVTPVFGCGS
jgi:hypothetical protein